MAINPEDVRLFESQRLSDEDDGGGRATGRVVVDGQINNLFQDVSRLDRTIGDVSLRKAFVGIDTDNTDLYLGAHAIIVEPPADPNVSVLLFDAGSESDERLSAQQRVEAYTVQGSRARFELLGNQYENQRQIICIQRLETSLPTAGQVYVLKSGSVTQFVRIAKVEHEEQVFTVASGSGYTEFTRRRLVLGLGSKLEQTFPGGEPIPQGTSDKNSLGQNKSEVFGTEVADAARYWGVTRSTEDADIGDLSIEVGSIYSSLVPSAQTEQPLADQPLGYNRRSVRASADADITHAVTAAWISAAQIQLILRRPCVPGSLELTLAGNGYTDGGNGVLTRTSGSFPLSTLSIDYETGIIQGTRDSGTDSGTETGSATFRPGAPYSGRAITDSIDINIGNRAYNYVRTYSAKKPRPGTLQIAYMVLGKWYEIDDPGNGQLTGDGSGSVNFVTGTLAITLLALPDVGTSIIISFLMDIEEEVEIHTGELADAIPEIVIQLDPGITPESVAFTYLADDVEKTLADDGSGQLTGDGTGTINYSTGEVRLALDVLHDDGSSISVIYDVGDTLTQSATHSAGVVTGTLAGAPLVPGTVSASWSRTTTFSNGNYTSTLSHPFVVRDDGEGTFGPAGGTINYTTGEFTLNAARPWTERRSRISGIFFAPENVERPGYPDAGVTFRYRESETATEEATGSFNPDQLTIPLISNTDDMIVPSSLLFEFAGQMYFDRDGVLYHSHNTQTGAAVAVGSVNYLDRSITLETWAGGSEPGITIHAALTIAATTVVSRMVFRTPGAPIRPESLQIAATDTEGNEISVIADSDGVLSSARLAGTVDYQTGIVRLWFTTDAGDETDASDVFILPGTGVYNAVLFSFLPLDAELIGLDPVRLPSDGRVPIFREGDVIVVSHSAETIAGTPTDGQVVTLDRDHQASILVFDDNGIAMDPAQYTVNLLAGTVTFSDPVLLQDVDEEELVVPLVIRDRIEHMSVLHDVEIGGRLSFIAPLAHEYPAEETVVSSALLWGDINAREFSYFTQKTWVPGAPNWTSSRIGDDTTSNYNLIDHPIEIANNGAVTEKWAIVFTSSTAYYVVGEQLGVIATGTTMVDLMPINPNTDNPYFVLRAAGWGGGWAAGNAVRFNTEGCLAPIWICRTVKSGAASEDDDRFVLQIRGDAD
jgi:hypothetical protein